MGDGLLDDEGAPDPDADRRRIWWLDGGAIVWSVGLVVIGLGISTPSNVTQNAHGAIVSTGGTSLLVPFGVFALGVAVIVTQITARSGGSTRLMPVAWALAGGLVVASVLATLKVGPTLVPPGVALVFACYYARRRGLALAE